MLWSRFGPYHLARLEGARSVGDERGVDIIGIEVAGEDGVYEWDRVTMGSGSDTTIFPNRQYEKIAKRSLRAAVVKALDASGCNIVAVNGWSVPEAQAGLRWRHAKRSRRAVLMSETKRDDTRRVWIKEWFKRRIVEKADTALVGGRAQVDYLSEIGVPTDRIFTGYNSVDNEYFERSSRIARSNAKSLQQRFGLPKNYFLACTRFLRRKNIDGLLKAYSQYLHAHGADAWGLVILGSGKEEAKLKNLADTLDLESVVWAGFVQYESLPVYYGLASAFIHPAHTEPWGLVVNEAAATGLPLLVSHTVGAAYELVNENVNGFLFDPSDPDRICQAMSKISDSDGRKRQEMSECSRQIAHEWSPRRFGLQLIRAAEMATSLPDR